MLRISPSQASDGTTLRLEGRLSGPWVEELRRACEPVLARGDPLILDLAEVSFLDEAAVALLRRLRARRVALLRPSLFVAHTLEG